MRSNFIPSLESEMPGQRVSTHSECPFSWYLRRMLVTKYFGIVISHNVVCDLVLDVRGSSLIKHSCNYKIKYVLSVYVYFTWAVMCAFNILRSAKTPVESQPQRQSDIVWVFLMRCYCSLWTGVCSRGLGRKLSRVNQNDARAVMHDTSWCLLY